MLGGTSRTLIFIAIGAASMAVLIPIMKQVFKTQSNYVLGAIFGGLALVFALLLRKPIWGYAAAAVGGLVVGSDLLGGLVTSALAATTSSSPPPALPQPAAQGGSSATQNRPVTVRTR